MNNNLDFSDDEFFEFISKLFDSRTAIYIITGILKAPIIGGVFSLAGISVGLGWYKVIAIFICTSIPAVFGTFRRVLEPASIIVALLTMIEIYFPGALLKLSTRVYALV